jgi:hypothetical protein
MNNTAPHRHTFVRRFLIVSEGNKILYKVCACGQVVT